MPDLTITLGGGIATYNDIYVDSANPAVNYNSDTHLRLEPDTVTRIMIRASGEPGIAVVWTSALLYLYKTSHSGTFNIIAKEIASGTDYDDWVEETLTWAGISTWTFGSSMDAVASGGAAGWKSVGDITTILNGAQAQAGRVNICIRAETESGAGTYENYNKHESGAYNAKIDGHYNRQPYAPTPLYPIGGESVDTVVPDAQMRFTDIDTEDTCTHVQIIIYESDGVTLKYDTGIIGPLTPIANGGTVTYEIPVAAGLAYGNTYKWKVKLRDLHGASNSWSDYSALQSFVVQNPPSVTNLSPAEGDTVYTNAPQISWQYYQAQNILQKAYRVRINTSASWTTPLYDSGWISSALAYHQLLDGDLSGNDDYYTRVDVEANNSLTAYMEQGVDEYWTLSIINAPDSISLSFTEDIAKVTVDWTDDEGDTYGYRILVKQVAGDPWIIAGEVLAGTLTFDDYIAPIGTPIYAVVRIDTDGYTSNPDDCTDSIAVDFIDWWFISNDDSTINLRLCAVEQAPWSDVDGKQVFYPLGRTTALVESGDYLGVDLSLTFGFIEEHGMTAMEYVEGLRAVRDYVDGDVYLKSNMGHLWRVSVQEISVDPLDVTWEAYTVACRAVEV